MRRQLNNPKFYLMVLADTLLFVSAHVAAYLFRSDFTLTSKEIDLMKSVLPWLIPLKLATFYGFGLYRGMWRYTSLRDLRHLAQASLLSMLIAMAVILYLYRFHGFSRAVFVMDGVLTFLFVGGLRVFIRSLYSGFQGKKPMPAGIPRSRKTILIIGAGAAGEKILREIFENNQLHYEVVGFIDDDPQKQGRSIHGIPVLGKVDEIPRIIARRDVKQVLIAIPSAKGDQMRRIIDICKGCDVSYKTLPGIGEIIDGRVSMKVLRDVSYEDLLGRPPVELDIVKIRNYLDGQTVLITGCGGSIGSELCRQVIRFQPRSIVLLDASEANLFSIQMELQNELYFRKCHPILGHVQDIALMDRVFQKYLPRVVFHAAAYKHVPMLEKNPWEAVTNNILGSRVAMEVSIKYGAERFVLVSTDKAVRPANVMGSSKRVAEFLLQSFQGNETRFMAVRFGNVVGSSGSVIPLFRRQIEHGGPVTVTHPDVNRYFMTIPEASQMIIQAGAMGEGGEIFILKMGTPVRIADMARDLIRLSGKEPDVDIKIVYSGLRDGEKLYEELITEGEDIVPTRHDKVMVLRPNGKVNGLSDPQEFRMWLDRELEELYAAARRHDAAAIKKKLRGIVAEYVPQQTEAIL